MAMPEAKSGSVRVAELLVAVHTRHCGKANAFHIQPRWGIRLDHSHTRLRRPDCWVSIMRINELSWPWPTFRSEVRNSLPKYPLAMNWLIVTLKEKESIFMFLFLTFAFLLPSFSPTRDPHNHIKQSQISKLTVYLEASDLRGADIQKHHITIFHPDPVNCTVKLPHSTTMSLFSFLLELDEKIDTILCESNIKNGDKGKRLAWLFTKFKKDYQQRLLPQHQSSPGLCAQTSPVYTEHPWLHYQTSRELYCEVCRQQHHRLRLKITMVCSKCTFPTVFFRQFGRSNYGHHLKLL